MKTRFIFLILICFFCFGKTSRSQEYSKSVFNVNPQNDRKWLVYQNNSSALYTILSNEAFAMLQKREQGVSGLVSKNDWEKYRQDLKARLFSSLDRFKKTPLNAKITGTIKREGFTVEKIVFESHPRFYVTGCLFLPEKRQNPAPVVIYCSGHSETGFRSEGYQQVILNLVDKGFVVFAFDPIGQGERLQYTDPVTGKSKAGGPTTEHSVAGAQTLLTGTSLADYFTWDGVRVIDYLMSRPEIDPERIGITGRSGGGTQTAFIAAYDNRIYAAAPECYITNFKRLLQSVGPQDAEQNPYYGLAKGFDFPDFLHLRAPKPTLIVTTTGDFFSIQGARETYAEALKSYTAFGYPGNIAMTEDSGVHESTLKNREAVYAFFRDRLNLPGDNTDKKIPAFSPEELRITTTGQVSSSFHGETVSSLNRKYFQTVEHPAGPLKETVTGIAGISFLRKLTSVVYTGKFRNNGAGVEKYFLGNSMNDYALPVYVINKETMPAGKTMIWLHPEGKEKILSDPLLNKIIDAGFTVVSADLPGTGELRDPGFRGDGFVQGVPFNYTFGLNLTGKSIPGVQAEALDVLVQFLENDIRFRGKIICALADGITCSPLLHFAALRNPLMKIALRYFQESNAIFMNTEFYDPELVFSVAPGSLGFYDIPDLIASLPAGSCRIFNPVHAYNERLGKETDMAEILMFLTDIK